MHAHISTRNETVPYFSRATLTQPAQSPAMICCISSGQAKVAISTKLQTVTKTLVAKKNTNANNVVAATCKLLKAFLGYKLLQAYDHLS